MIIANLNDPQSQNRLSQQIEKFERLLIDLSDLRFGRLPAPATLFHAPFLENYAVTTRKIPALTGCVTGHPEIEGNRTPMMSSQLMVFLGDEGIARTMSRWYRLGNRAGH